MATIAYALTGVFALAANVLNISRRRRLWSAALVVGAWSGSTSGYEGAIVYVGSMAALLLFLSARRPLDPATLNDELTRLSRETERTFQRVPENDVRRKRQRMHAESVLFKMANDSAL